jgi:hypothetical protein
MTKIPEPRHSIAALIDQFHESQEDKPRPHMGCSQLGHPCDRWLWLSFRWAVREQFSGRMLRLFRRGQNEEATIVADLRAIGMDIQNTGERNQKRVKFGAHVSGSLDGVIYSGVPEAPETVHVAEFKTHSKKSFDDLEKQGVEKSKPMHFVQMQVYMHGIGAARALYLAVCKDDDRLYTKRVRYDKKIALWAIERGKRLALADRMPPPISTDATWYQCRFCPAHSFCHKQEPTRFANCRTCAHSTAKENSTWRCERHDADNIPTEFQHKGCDDHVLHPDLVPWRMEPSEDGHSVTWMIDGKPVVNGTGGYKSREILANPSACTGHELVEAARRIFPDGEVIG